MAVFVVGRAVFRWALPTKCPPFHKKTVKNTVEFWITPDDCGFVN